MSIEVRSLVKGATILLLALAWNEAAKKFVNVLFPIKNNESKSMFHNAIIYAVFITLILVCLVAFFNFIHVKTVSPDVKQEEDLITKASQSNVLRNFKTGLFRVVN
jgi:hypothetical protein